MTYLNSERNKYFEGDGSRNEEGQDLNEFLEKYDPNDYKNPCSTIDTAVFTFNEDDHVIKILLIKRKNHPSIGLWVLPGGFVEFEEDIDITAERELEEETGITGLSPVQFRTYGMPERDPRTRIITTLYVSFVNEKDICPRAGDDAKDAALFNISLKEDKGGRYRLELNCDERELFLYAVLERDVSENGLVPVVRYRIIETCGIGLDHAMLIADAFEFVMRNKKNG